MATRAQIAVFDKGNGRIKSVYSHYDGGDYMKNELNTYFNNGDAAEKLVDNTSIRAISDGEVDYFNDGGAEVIVNSDLRDLAMEFAELADSGSADYIHFWDGEKWNSLRHQGIRSSYDRLLDLWEVDEMMPMEETYEKKWQKFLAEGDAVNENIDLDAIEKYIEKVTTGDAEGGEQLVNFGLDAYMDSLRRDIQAGRIEGYAEFSMDDYVEDFENYVADKMDS